MRKITTFIVALLLTAVGVMAQQPKFSTEQETTWYIIQNNQTHGTRYLSVGTVSETQNALKSITTYSSLSKEIIFKLVGDMNSFQFFSATNPTLAMGSTSTEGGQPIVIGRTPENNFKMQQSTAQTDFFIWGNGTKNVDNYDDSNGLVSYWETYPSDHENRRIKFIEVSVAPKIAEANTRLEETTEGSSLGEFSTEARTALQNVINNNQAATTDGIDEILSKINAIEEAISTYNSSVNAYCTPNAGTYTTRRIASGTIVIGATTIDMPTLQGIYQHPTAINVKRGEEITITITGETNTRWGSAFAFFDWNGDMTYAQDGTQTGFQLSTTFEPITNGERQFIAVGDGTTPITNKSITITVPETAKLGKTGMRITCDEYQSETNTHANPSDPCYQVYSGSSYSFVLNISDKTTNIANTKVSKLNISVVNGVIAVDGVENFEVYGLTGQLINAKQPLSKGVYIVKTATASQKVVVK